MLRELTLADSRHVSTTVADAWSHRLLELTITSGTRTLSGMHGLPCREEDVTPINTCVPLEETMAHSRVLARMRVPGMCIQHRAERHP